ncbi:MAG TPA: peptide chain release factor 1 [Clostridiaceae bacterium]|nr:peptide chain release factor 1 [Clostridiaceae bacterium]
MNPQFEQILKRYEELMSELANPEVYENQSLYVAVVKEQSELEPIVTQIKAVEELADERDELQMMYEESDASDVELRQLLRDERQDIEAKYEQAEEKLKLLLIPGDPNDEKNVYMEIRSGAGGEEAALFAQELYRMYESYATQCGYQTEVVDISETELGGLKEIVFMISGRGAYSRLKYEMGVHRVQRVPITESGGRIHTSTCTVAVMPEVDEVDIEINPADLQIDTYRASGAGGHHVNKTSSAIRITHLPTGTVVTCQDQRSQHKNKDRAMSVLRSRLYEMEQAKVDQAVSAARKAQVGTGDRSERIRTYNYHQSRVTDHRINLTLYKLEDILAGDLDLIVEPLIEFDRAAQLGASHNNAE